MGDPEGGRDVDRPPDPETGLKRLAVLTPDPFGQPAATSPRKAPRHRHLALSAPHEPHDCGVPHERDHIPVKILSIRESSSLC